MAAPPAENLAWKTPEPSPAGATAQYSASPRLGTVCRYALTVLLPVVVTATGAMAAVNQGQVRLYWTMGAIVSTAGLAFFNILKDVSLTKAELPVRAAIMRCRIAIAEASQPLITNLTRVSAARGVGNKRAKVDTLIDRAVSVLRVECGTGSRSSYRSSFYELNGDVLLRKRYEGRPGDHPRLSFDPADPDDARRRDAERAVAIAKGEKAVVVEDLLTSAEPLISNPRARSYRTFLAAPVNADDRRFGLLCLDSPEPHTLNKIDKHNIMLIAGVLAAGLAQVRQ